MSPTFPFQPLAVRLAACPAIDLQRNGASMPRQAPSGHLPPGRSEAKPKAHQAPGAASRFRGLDCCRRCVRRVARCPFER